MNNFDDMRRWERVERGLRYPILMLTALACFGMFGEIAWLARASWAVVIIGHACSGYAQWRVMRGARRELADIRRVAAVRAQPVRRERAR